MIDIEKLSGLELDELQAKYEKIKAECSERQRPAVKEASSEPDQVKRRS